MRIDRLSRLLCLVTLGFLTFAGCRGEGGATAGAPAAGDSNPAAASGADSARNTSTAAGSEPAAPAPAPAQAPPGAATVTATLPPGAIGQPGAPPAAAAGPLVPSGPPTQVVAKVNGVTITRGELDFAIRNIVADGLQVPPDHQVEFRQHVLDGMVDQELIFQKARSSNFAVSDAELNDQLGKIKSKFPDENTFTTQLAQDGLTPALIETMLRKSMTINKYITSTIVQRTKVTPEEEGEFYKENIDKMKHPEQVRASHILLRTQQNSPEAEKTAQRSKAEEALVRARKGEDFGALAKQYSQDTGSAQRGGDIGYFGKGDMVPAFETAAWSLKKGEISGIVTTPFGFHIIKVTDRRPEGSISLDEARAQINKAVSDQKIKDEYEKLRSSLRTAAKVEVSL